MNGKTPADVDSKSEEFQGQQQEYHVFKGDMTAGSKVEPSQRDASKAAGSCASQDHDLQDLKATEATLEHKVRTAHEAGPDVFRNNTNTPNQMGSIQSSCHNLNGKRHPQALEVDGDKSNPVQETEHATKRRAMGIDNTSEGNRSPTDWLQRNVRWPK